MTSPNVAPKNFISSCGEYAIPRVYSGVASDFGWLRNDDAPDRGFAILDIPFSFVVDTVVLPYTIFMQAKYGNLCDTWEAE